MKYYIGIDIGGTSIKAGVVDQKGNPIPTGAGSCETKARRHYSEIIADIVDLVKFVIKGAGLTEAGISGIGMGIPGTIDSEAGVIIYSNNINFENVPIVSEFRKHIDLPIKIDNDANCAALGEVKFGSGKGYKNAVFITLGTGVGSGIIIDGKIFAGRRGAGAEAGHTLLVMDGEQCTCGRRGCWEAYASATGLIRITNEAIKKNPDSKLAQIADDDKRVSGRTAFKARKMGCPIGAEVVDLYVKYVAEGLVNIVNVFRPDVIMIGGGISNEGPYFIKMLEDYVNDHSYGGKRNPHVGIVGAKLLNNAGVLGAAALVIQ